MSRDVVDRKVANELFSLATGLELTLARSFVLYDVNL